MSDEHFREILRRYWGYDDFRGIQLDIIRSIAEGRDTIGLMPTGGGKSITFQVPALAQDGLCLVVTPLIALMKDQVARLRALSVKAAAVYSGQSREEVLRNLDNCIYGDYKFLYVSPERIASELFREKLRHMRVSFITVDEAHCLSQWGFDFRPSYLQLTSLRELLPGAPVLALTATATARVLDDIRRVLLHPDARLFRMSFERKNLAYVVRQTEHKEEQLLHILRSVPGSAIVYTRSRKGTAETAEFLRQEGISALHYHAGLPAVEKDIRQNDWQEGATRVMVATNAFGMGIDKPDVRLVVHMDTPDSVEAYFQEAGRAGRDGKRAYAVLLYNRRDRTKMLRRVSDTFPPKDYVRRVYDALAYFFQLAAGDGYGVTYELNLEKFCQNFRFFPTQAVSALNILTRAGFISYRDEEDNASRVLFIVQRDELYRLRHLSPAAERLIAALLRRYTGLFSDYAFIDEAMLAHDCACSQQEVYELLVALTHQRIVHYVPRKAVPRVTYVQRRIDGDRLFIPADVYEERREQFEARIGAMLRYAEQTDQCRSRYLLSYFGDEEASDCGCCDVCLARRSAPALREDVAAYVERQLAARGPVGPGALPRDRFSPEEIGQAVHVLARRGRVRLDDDGRLCLCGKGSADGPETQAEA